MAGYRERHLIDQASGVYRDEQGRTHDARELIQRLGEKNTNGKKIPASCIEELITNSRELLLARGLSSDDVIELASYVIHMGFSPPADWVP